MNEFEELARRAAEQPDISLEQPFYCDDSVFERDMSAVFHRQWILVGHVSQIPEPGSFFLIDVGNESIIVVRESATEVNAFFNVCRHRGSRVCLQQHGKTRLLVCPYHAWSYALDGSLKSARLMPENFDANEFALHRCHLEIFEGLIFLNLSPTVPPSVEMLFGSYRPLALQQGVARAKVAATRSYPTGANWKLVVENFIECYHCAPAHPEYCAVHSKLKLLARGAGYGSGPADAEAEFAPVQDAWIEYSRSLGHLNDDARGGSAETGEYTASRTLINEGFVSETIDGNPACSRLMGTFKEYDGGITYLVFNDFSYVFGFNDFAVLIRFTPRSAMQTDVEFTWLVDEQAEEGRDYDPERMIHVWDVTTKQDKRITEDNQAGILSARYTPGPYSIQEKNLPRFKQWYLHQLSP